MTDLTDEECFDLVRRWNAVGPSGDTSTLDDLVTADFVAHNGDDDVVGSDGWRGFMSQGGPPLGPDETGIDELIRSGSFVAERWWIRTKATDTGDPVAVHGITIHRIADGRLAENWAVVHLDS